MTPHRRTALAAGAFYLLTFVSIPTLSLYGPVMTSGHVLTAGDDRSARWAAFLEVVVALACIGTAVTLHPVLREHGPARSTGFVAARTLEASMIFAGVASVLTLISLRSPGAAPAQADALLITEKTLIGIYHSTFLLGQSLMPALNAVLLGTLMLRSRLVPRAIPLIGLVGAPIHLTAVLLTMFGVLDRISPVTAIAALPIAAWEFSLGVYLVVRGFRSDQLRDRAASS